jgi:dCMP deaminase
MISNKWDLRFLSMSELVGSWSKDPSSKVGAVIVDSNNRVVSVGYNGLPKYILNEEKYLVDRELKYAVILHAERNAIIFSQMSLSGCTVYTTPFLPCPACASMIIQSGITRVVSYKLTKDMLQYDRWYSQIELSKQLFAEAGVLFDELVASDLVKPSLSMSDISAGNFSLFNNDTRCLNSKNNI